MRRILGTLALLLTLAGCGDDTDVAEQTDDPTPTPSGEVTLVSGTAGGGTSASQATDVSDKDALAAYVEQFDSGLASKVAKAVAAVDGGTVLAQVVAIGCDVPPGARLDGDAIVPAKVEQPMQECFAPVTTVAVAVP